MNSVSNKNDDEPRTLPTNRAFVLQFRQFADLKQGRVEGRIEHIASGQASLFESLEEMVTFLEGIVSSAQSESNKL